jgi:glutamate formiminotransferase
MSVIVIPNVSEGRVPAVIHALAETVVSAGARILDVHTDARHNRSVFTVAGETLNLARAMTSLATRAVELIDLTGHEGVHPRVGALDVCPFVALHGAAAEAVEAARVTGERIGAAGIPVYLYGRGASRSLPEIRRGGLERLIERSGIEPPDFGPRRISPAAGVVCVGARDVLIAFNVWLAAEPEAARLIARDVREGSAVLPGVRALGLEIAPGVSQVSMNLVSPEVTGIDAAFAFVERRAIAAGVPITGTEIVGLVPERFMPDPKKKAARLLISPGRSLESALTKR